MSVPGPLFTFSFVQAGINIISQLRGSEMPEPVSSAVLNELSRRRREDPKFEFHLARHCSKRREEYKCDNCGGPVSSKVLPCDWCGTPVD